MNEIEQLQYQLKESADLLTCLVTRVREMVAYNEVPSTRAHRSLKRLCAEFDTQLDAYQKAVERTDPHGEKHPRNTWLDVEDSFSGFMSRQRPPRPAGT